MSTLPQPSRQTSSLPATTPISRKTLAAPSEFPRTPSSGQLMSKLRTPSSARPPAITTPQQTDSSSSLPTLRSTSSAVKVQPAPSLRRTISIASFPQPPKSPRPSISSGTGIPASTASNAGSRTHSPRESTSGIATPGSVRMKKPSRLSTSTVGSARVSLTPSLLSGGADGKSIPSDSAKSGFVSIPSPTPSRSSSAQGSAASTSATTFEDIDDASRRGTDVGDSKTGTQRSGKDGAKDGKGNVIVSVRVRPDAGSNDASKSEGEWMVDGRRSLVSYRGKEGGDYFYDNVFATHDNNSKVYDASAKRLVRQVMEGYHGTVFAYGMTGTGKTFSMQGTASSPGVIPLAITDIFSFIRETPHREFLLRVSYLEIYNEKINDLLSAPTTAPIGPPQPTEEIKLREDSKRGVYATPLKEEIVQSPTQLLRVIARGDQARRVGSTQFNARSSRSHAVVQIVVESRERNAAGPASDNKRSAIVPGGVRVSTLSLIDLAGSERAAENKERRTEGAHINKSLLTLGNVISGLADKDKTGADKDGKHLPYRDSKLTRLLQGALSGNSLVSILCTIQLGAGAGATTNHIGETINTLKFAARAKNNIVSHAKKAEEAHGAVGDAGSRALLDRYRMEIQNLRSQLDQQVKEQDIDQEEEKQLEKEAEARREEQMLEMQLARTALKERIEHLNRLILSSQSIGVNTHTSGSFSSLGHYGHHRLSGATDIGGGTRSLRSSASQSTLGIGTFHRTASTTSLPSGRTSLGTSIISPRPSFQRTSEDDEESTGEYGDGLASLQAQNQALQADIADKNRYISTLEKRLLHARRSSHSRTSAGFAKNGVIGEEGPDLTASLKEKDREIEELKARLEDKDRMLMALRSATRQRDIAEFSPEMTPTDSQRSPGRRVTSNPLDQSQGHSPVSPLGLLSPSKKPSSYLNAPENKTKRKSIDEMSKMLDEMIQDRVESGQLLKSSRGTVRLPNGDASLPSIKAAESETSAQTPPQTPLPSVNVLVSGLNGTDQSAADVATN